MSDNLAIAGFAVGLAGTAGTAFGLRQSGKHHNVNTSWTEKTFEQDKLSATTALAAEHMDGKPVRVLEIGPRAGASTPWCTSALAICAACGLGAKLERIALTSKDGAIPH